MISRLTRKSKTEYVMLERQPFLTKHLSPKNSNYSRIENVPKEMNKYKVVYVKNNTVYRRIFFNKFSYADKAYVAMCKILMGKEQPIWNPIKHIMEDGIPVPRAEGFKRWILRKTNWMHS